MRRKSTILSVAVTVMISLCLMLTGKVGFDTPAFAAMSLMVAMHIPPYLLVCFARLQGISDIKTADRIRIDPRIIRTVMVSCRMMTENTVPNTASMDRMMADFVSSTYFWETVCSK